MKRALVITARDPFSRTAGDVIRLNSIVTSIPDDYQVVLIVLRSTRNVVERSYLSGRKILVIKFNPSNVATIIQILINICRYRPLQSAAFFPYTSTWRYRKIKERIKPSLFAFHLFRSIPTCELERKMPKSMLIDMCDLQSLNYQLAINSCAMSLIKRIFLRYELATSRRIERKISYFAQNISFISEHDACEYIKREKHHILAKVSVANNIYPKANLSITHDNKKGRYIALVGNFSAWHNVMQVDTLLTDGSLELLRTSERKIKLIGHMTLRQEKKFKNQGFCTVRSPSSIKKHLLDCDFGLCIPSASAGFQTKLVDYIDAGLVVVCSPQVADGAGLIDNVSCLVYRKRDDLQNLDSISELKKAQISKNAVERMSTLRNSSLTNWSKIMQLSVGL